MKGIAHFAIGVAAASCFPAAVEAGASGNPLYFLLGGIFGLLPDTIDFRFRRFLERRDIEIAPDPLEPDAQPIADGIADAVRQAHARGKPIRLRLNTVRLGPDEWQEYEVHFDVAARKVHVRYGPVVNTGTQPVRRGPHQASSEASAALPCPLRLEYRARTTVNIFGGPEFRLEPQPDGSVIPRFIPWHRDFSHSLGFALLAGASCLAVWGVTAGLVASVAIAAHVAADQLGTLGSAVLWPLSRRRIPGIQLVASGATAPGLAAVLGAALVVFWNLQAAAPPPHAVPARWMAIAVVTLLGACALVRRRVPAAAEPAGE